MIRSFAKPLLIVGALAAGVLVASAQGQAPSAVGLWEHVEDGKPAAWFRIVEKGGVYEGQIVKMFPKQPGEDPASFRCTKCEGDRKNAPVLGITMIKGMQRSGLDYQNGNILDPRDGSVYNAMMQLSPDGKQLTVRGYLGIALFGQSQIWKRLPDTAMGAEPGATTASAPGGAKRAQTRAAAPTTANGGASTGSAAAPAR